jgi:hypothetical protein
MCSEVTYLDERIWVRGERWKVGGEGTILHDLPGGEWVVWVV